MDEITSTRISRATNKAVRWQLGAAAVISLASLLISGVNAAISAMLGASAVVAGSYAALMTTRGRPSATAGGALVTLLKAEIIKIMVIAAVLLLVFKIYTGLVPLALIGGLAGAALMSGVGLRTIENENTNN